MYEHGNQSITYIYNTVMVKYGNQSITYMYNMVTNLLPTCIIWSPIYYLHV